MAAISYVGRVKIDGKWKKDFGWPTVQTDRGPCFNMRRDIHPGDIENAAPLRSGQTGDLFVVEVPDQHSFCAGARYKLVVDGAFLSPLEKAAKADKARGWHGARLPSGPAPKAAKRAAKGLRGSPSRDVGSNEKGVGRGRGSRAKPPAPAGRRGAAKAPKRRSR